MKAKARHAFRSLAGVADRDQCPRCGVTRWHLIHVPRNGTGLRSVELYRLPGRTEWTDTRARCAAVKV